MRFAIDEARKKDTFRPVNQLREVPQVSPIADSPYLHGSHGPVSMDFLNAKLNSVNLHTYPKERVP